MSREKQIEEMAKVLERVCDEIVCSDYHMNCDLCQATYLYNAGYRKQSENTIELPCKVGDTVYSFCDVFGAILPYVIQNFGVGFMGYDRPNYWFWEATSHATETDELLDEIDFDLDNIGKTVFLTQAEAEKALAKMKGGAE